MKRLFTIIASAAVGLCASAALTFSGNTLKVLSEKPEASTGLNDLYVLNAVGGVKATYTATSADAQVKWYRYSTLGAGYAEEIAGISHRGKEWTIESLEGDMGYMIEEGTARYYCWIVDYGRHRFSISALTPGPEQDCTTAALIPAGYGDRIVYYSINGRALELNREITLQYNTLAYDETAEAFVDKPVTATFAYLSETLHAPAPLCNTQFLLTGDRFLKAWGQEVSVESSTYKAVAVEAHTDAVMTERDNDNEQKDGDTSTLGGSAPAEITFSAQTTDAVVFTEWQFSTYPDFQDVQTRFNQTEVTFTFTEQGTTYVRFMAANNEGTCDYYGPTYEVFIGESALVCPNAFSPGASEGVNDEWKVSYKSIVTFECHIFNRWGTKMKSFTDPAQGWDGKYGGKLVPAGVYYYVINATGADGKEYKLRGDINIVNYK